MKKVGRQAFQLPGDYTTTSIANRPRLGVARTWSEGRRIVKESCMHGRLFGDTGGLSPAIRNLRASSPRTACEAWWMHVFCEAAQNQYQFPIPSPIAIPNLVCLPVLKPLLSDPALFRRSYGTVHTPRPQPSDRLSHAATPVVGPLRRLSQCSMYHGLLPSLSGLPFFTLMCVPPSPLRACGRQTDKKRQRQTSQPNHASTEFPINGR